MKFFALLFTLATLASCQIRDKSKTEIDTLKVQEERNGTTVEVKEAQYEFGDLLEGEVVLHEFEFTNTGNVPLIIDNATAACGCTIPEKPLEAIMPGETGKIKVKFNSSGRKGRMHKSVTVESNATNFPPLVLKGNVIKKEE